jgi:hypothetical protein
LTFVAPRPAVAQHSFVDASVAASTWREDRKTSPGWTGSFAIYVSQPVGIVAEFGEYRGLPQSFGMGGVRVRWAGRTATPFVQILFGQAPRSDLALQPGVGVDRHFFRDVAVRLAADVKVSGDDGATYLAGRFGAGLVLLVGR